MRVSDKEIKNKHRKNYFTLSCEVVFCVLKSFKLYIFNKSAIQLIKKVPTEHLDKALKGAGISTTDIKFAKSFIENPPHLDI